MTFWSNIEKDVAEGALTASGVGLGAAVYEEIFGKPGDKNHGSFTKNLLDPVHTVETVFSDLGKGLSGLFHHDSKYDYPTYGLPDVQMLDEGYDIKKYVVDQFDKITGDRLMTPEAIDKFMQAHPDMPQAERAALHEIETHFPHGASKADIEQYADGKIARSALII